MTYRDVLVICAAALAPAWVGGCYTAESLVDGGIACTPAVPCAAGTTCVDGLCGPSVTCTSSRTCDGLVCDPATSTCVECAGPLDCSDGERCITSICVPGTACTSDRNCSGVGLVCDVVDGFCVACNVAADCADGFACTPTHNCVRNVDSGGGLDEDGTTPDLDGGMGNDGGNDAEVLDAGIDASVDADPADSAIGTDAPRADSGVPCDDPLAFRGLYQWLVADRGLAVAGGFVTSWADQSGNGNHVVATGAPRLRAPEGTVPQSVELIGGSLHETCTDCETWGVGVHSAIAFAFVFEGGGGQQIWGRGRTEGTGFPRFQIQPVGVRDLRAYLSSFSGEALLPIAISTTPIERVRIVMVERRDTAMVSFVDGVQYALTGNPVIAALTAEGPTTIGPYGGRLVELIVAGDPFFRPEDAQCMQTYLVRRYGTL